MAKQPREENVRFPTTHWTELAALARALAAGDRQALGPLILRRYALAAGAVALALAIWLPFANGVHYDSEEQRSAVSAAFGASSIAKPAMPVTFTPGLLRLVTRPNATGSPAMTKTIGMVVVAAFAASAGSVPTATITATRRRTRSAASEGSRSNCFSA